jgi:hypothetical protein
MGVAIQRGFRATKFESKGGFGHGTLKEDVLLLTLVRDVIGPDRDLMVDVQNA